MSLRALCMEVGGRGCFRRFGCYHLPDRFPSEKLRAAIHAHATAHLDAINVSPAPACYACARGALPMPRERVQGGAGRGDEGIWAPCPALAQPDMPVSH